MKKKQKIPDALRKQLSRAGKRGWQAKIAKALKESKKVAIVITKND